MVKNQAQVYCFKKSLRAYIIWGSLLLLAVCRGGGGWRKRSKNPREMSVRLENSSRAVVLKRTREASCLNNLRWFSWPERVNNDLASGKRLILKS